MTDEKPRKNKAEHKEGEGSVELRVNLTHQLH